MKKIRKILSLLLLAFIFVTYLPSIQAKAITQQQQQQQQDAIIAEAKKHLGASYVSGAAGPDTFDCSGFVQYVYKQALGIQLNRTTYDQIKQGISVSQNELQPGDLIFPLNNEHVQIYIGNGQVIHAPHSGSEVQIVNMYGCWQARRIIGVIPANVNLTPDFTNAADPYLYNPEYYRNRYPDLRGLNDTELKTHWLTCGINEGRTASPLYDPKYYCEKNPDVASQFGTNYRDIYNHFATIGYTENRTSSHVFDINYYRNAYSDLRSLSSLDLLRHFVDCGMNEGRQASAIFNPNEYKENYRDLKKAFGENTKLYYWHYECSGVAEQRIGVFSSDLQIGNYLFNAEYYSYRYPDLNAKFGTDENALYKHWIDCGINEGRTASPIYEPNYYLQKNPDVAAKFGNNYREVFNHFVTAGYKEGRDSSPVFNVVYYKNVNADLSSFSNFNLYKHFMTCGINEGRSSSPNFNATKYKNNYADLSSLYGNRMKYYYWHYLTYGINEKRHAI